MTTNCYKNAFTLITLISEQTQFMCLSDFTDYRFVEQADAEKTQIC